MEPSSLTKEEPISWDELYDINLVPSELFLKFRKEIEGFRMGINLEFYNAASNDYKAKLVVKPLAPEKRWKFIGVGHSFGMQATGCKWNLTTCLGGDGISRIRNKTKVGLFPGMDVRFGWRAEYVLPEVHGAVGTGEPIFNWDSGRLQASLDRVETIFTM
ncbi:hypothetical protein ACHQM5_029413 [Ranunculus cassubicifolius]